MDSPREDRERAREMIRRVFFEAMKQGWAAGTKATPSVEVPGEKIIIHKSPPSFVVVDRYFSHPITGNSTGSTTIWWNEEPLWAMYYGGFYPEKTIAFLKKALLATYDNNLFCGGRGNLFFEDEEYLYTNRPRPQYDGFEKFDGREEIFSRRGVFLGWHEYWGMSLI